MLNISKLAAAEVKAVFSNLEITLSEITYFLLLSEQKIKKLSDSCDLPKVRKADKKESFVLRYEAELPVYSTGRHPYLLGDLDKVLSRIIPN